MILYEAVGFIAGTLSVVSFIPQVHKTWKEKSRCDFQLGGTF